MVGNKRKMEPELVGTGWVKKAWKGTKKAAKKVGKDVAKGASKASKSFAQESQNAAKSVAKGLRKTMENRTLKNAFAVWPPSAIAYGVVEGVVEAKSPADLPGSIVKYTSKEGARTARVVAAAGNLVAVAGAATGQPELVALGGSIGMTAGLAGAALSSGDYLADATDAAVHGDGDAFLKAMGNAVATSGPAALTSLSFGTFDDLMTMSVAAAQGHPDAAAQAAGRVILDAAGSESGASNYYALATDYGAPKDGQQQAYEALGVGKQQDTATQVAQADMRIDQGHHDKNSSGPFPTTTTEAKNAGEMLPPPGQTAPPTTSTPALSAAPPPAAPPPPQQTSSSSTSMSSTGTTSSTAPGQTTEIKTTEEPGFEQQREVLDAIDQDPNVITQKQIQESKSMPPKIENADADLMMQGGGNYISVDFDALSPVEETTPYQMRRYPAYRGEASVHGASGVKRMRPMYQNPGLSVYDLHPEARVKQSIDNSLQNPTVRALKRTATIRGFTSDYTNKPRMAPSGHDARGDKSYLMDSIRAMASPPLTKDEVSRILTKMPRVRTVAVDEFKTSFDQESMSGGSMASGDFMQTRSRSVYKEPSTVPVHY